MMRARGIPVWLIAWLCLLARRAVAQGCASCYTTAAAGGPQTAHALRGGIILLLVPSVLMFAGLVFLVKQWTIRYPNTFANNSVIPAASPDAQTVASWLKSLCDSDADESIPESPSHKTGAQDDGIKIGSTVADA